MKYVFYHADCVDGFTAAWCFHRKGGYTLIPLKYGDWAKTRALVELRPDDEVLFVDVSIPPDDVVKLAREVKHVHILDHHKTAADAWSTGKTALEQFPPVNVTAFFDLAHSGAWLAWHYCFGAPEPALVRYVQDRDLWKHELPNTEAINAWISAHPYVLGAYDALHDCWSDSYVTFGDAILLSKQKVIDEIVKKAQDFELCGVNVKAVNYGSTHGVSEIGHELAKLSRDGCGLVWRMERDLVEVSLRGHNGRDVSQIAKAFGGGGHPGAAGFRVPLEKFLTEYNPRLRIFVASPL